MSEILNAALSRQAWVDACEFHDLTEEGVLREVARRVTEVKAERPAQGHPIVLLDLDSTLYEVAPRTHQILKEWVDSEQSEPFEKVREAMGELLSHQVGYSVRDTLNLLNLDPDGDEEVGKAHRSAKDFWRKRFFTSAYLKYDHAYPGAAAFVRELHEMGAELVYLTGRDEPGSGEGTRENLIRDGFPWNTVRTRLLMKEALEMDDLDHKVKAANFIREHGTLIASFENEPLNLAALYEIFPTAMHVFVDTVCSDRPAIPRRGLYRIKGFAC